MVAQRIAVYELAKELSLSNAELLARIRALGMDAKNHMSRLDPEQVQKIRRGLEQAKQESTVHEKLNATVIRRRSKEPISTMPVVEKPLVASQKEEPNDHESVLAPENPISPPTVVDFVPEPPPPATAQNVPAVGAPDEFEKLFLAAERNTTEPLAENVPVSAVTESIPPVELPLPPTSSPPVVSSPLQKSREGLGPTGRVIDLAALRYVPASADKGTPVVRGPRQEVIGERLRGGERDVRSGANRTPMGTGKSLRKPLVAKTKGQSTPVTVTAEYKRVVKMGDSIPIKDLANQMGIKATELLKKVWELGVRNVMINSPIDLDTAQLVASEFGWKVENTAFQESSVVQTQTDSAEDLKLRAPVITIMGHVDHGKTSLLDAIRNANVAAGEAGGITQHIGAYKVRGPAGDVVFLDTPGHEAFTEMRARGAQATDMVVLVVAADDGVMPQTLEALNHARDAKVPVVVAVNKIDKPGAQPERIRQQLSGYELTPEEWGGQTIYVDVSAKTRQGIDKLLEMLALQAEVLELKANPDKAAKGVVIEARMDAKRGAVSTILVQEGTLKVGDFVVVGEELGKVRAMVDDKGKALPQAGPSTPVELLGLSGVPRAGDVLNAVADERAARELVEHRRERRVDKERAKAGPVSLDKLMDAMKAGLKELKIILKADVQGSVEALQHALLKLSTNQVKVVVVQSGVGGITETDVNLAKAGNAVVIGFHVRPTGKAASLAEQEGVDIKLYDIIYDAIEDIKKASAGLLAPIKREKVLGRAEVRQVFHLSKVGLIAGCSVTEGLIRRNAAARLIRDSVLVHQGKLGSLRRFKDDVREVQQGYECGLSFEGYNDVKVGDVIESFETEEITPTFESMTPRSA